MTVYELMKEYGLELDDIRWFLSHRMAGMLMEYRERQEELVQHIWSKGLEDSLYNMEERFLEDLQKDMERGITDEPFLRETFLEALALRRKRY